MAASFDTGVAAAVGTTEATIYTAPTGTHLLMGMIATNTFGSAVGIDIKLVRGSDTIWLAHNRRIDPNKTEDILMGTKLSLTTGDLLKVKAPVNNAFSVIATVTQDVLT